MESDRAGSIGLLLSNLLRETGTPPLESEQTSQFEAYVSLFVRWNTRVNLSSIRDPQTIVIRHLLESIVCARMLPSGISTLLDFGSGGGLPGIPIAVCRPDFRVTLAEAQGKKAAFLQEAVRVLGLSTEVFAGRAETLTKQFDCVVLRAVDKMPRAAAEAATLVAASGWLGLMTTRSDMLGLIELVGAEFTWPTQHLLPCSADRLLALGKRAAS
jgi:16S rRNA (guanine527-N7)-methyltransferase